MPPLRERLERLRNEFLEYIENNFEKVSANIPVFYGYVISSLDQFSAEIGDEEYDRFIEAITIKLLERSQDHAETGFVERVCSNAIRTRKNTKTGIGIHLPAGISLLKRGDFKGATSYFAPYAEADGVVGVLLAYCYYMLSLREIAEKKATVGARPGDMELMAREQMLRIARGNPPIDRLPELQLIDQQMISRAFWLMISCALDWFPSEKRFLSIGLEKAKKDSNRGMINELLKIAVERFFDDMVFLRESFLARLQEQDAIGAAGVVRQMMQQHPEEIEPIYYGLLLSVLSAKQPGYDTFRRMATQKGMPGEVVLLMDLALAVAKRDQTEIGLALRAMRREYPDLQPYTLLLEYIAQDVFSAEEERKKRARKFLLDSVDRFCVNLIQERKEREG
ncbi:MAG: hypothetical protein QHG99_04640 [Methanomicrobiales archaeon]|nr:hypothetical protein [Methanomicrobiales archaeon]